MERGNQESEFSDSSDIDWPSDELSEHNNDSDLDNELNSEPGEGELVEFFEFSTLDAVEQNAVGAMYGDGNGDYANCCSLQCNKTIGKSIAVSQRQMFTEMPKKEQDAVILAQLQQCRRIRNLKAVYGKLAKRGSVRSNTDSPTLERQNIQYFFCAIPICRKMYFFLHDIGKKRYENLCHHFDKDGITQRVHQSKNKVPSRENVLSVDYIDKVVLFIKTFGDNYGLPLPGRLPNFKNYNVIKLPSSETKMSIYRKFCDTLNAEDHPRVIARSTFVTIWKQYCPYVTITKPASDLCGTCRENQLKVLRSANCSLTVKKQIVDAEKEHIENARKQREYYNFWRKLAAEKTTYQDDGVEKTFSVFSFDFAESLNYPFHPQQVGPIYFKTPRKCGLFGIHNESNRHQTHFLIDEADSVGKGANTVISLLHHFLESREQTDTLVLFADNCVGQNKNNAVLQYLLWRVLTGKNNKILYNFLVAGHTKFSPDRSFGMAKKKYSVSTIDCIEDLVDCIKSSSPNGLQSAIVTSKCDATGKRLLNWYDWTLYLQPLFATLPGLTQYHHFIFSSDGSLRTKQYADSNIELSYHLKTSDWKTGEDLMRIELIPEGLTLERQWYLFDHIRPFVIDEHKKDLVAPRPGPRPSKRKMKKTVKKSKIEDGCDNDNDDTGSKSGKSLGTRGRRSQKPQLAEPVAVAGPSQLVKRTRMKK